MDLQNLSVTRVAIDLGDVFARVGDRLPENIANAWDASRAMPSPAAKLVDGMEAAYAGMKASDDETVIMRIAHVLICAAHLVFENGFYGKADRALSIVNACRRVLNEDVPGDDPAVDPAFVPVAPPLSPIEAAHKILSDAGVAVDDFVAAVSPTTETSSDV